MMTEKTKSPQSRNQPWNNLFICTLLCCLFLFLPVSLLSDESINPEDLEGGTFFLVNPDTDEVTTSFTLRTDIHLKVTGIVLRGTVVQFFTNQSDTWMEGIYMFPLPDTAAVDTLVMKIGDRIIQGEIKEREEAKQVYEEAKEEGKKATLLEQERPDIFNVSVANIGPGETIEVMIEFQQPVDYDQGRYSITFPMVVGPRYIPLSMQDEENRNSPGIHPEMATDPADITAPVNPSQTDDSQISLRIDLLPGFPAKNIESPYLPVTIESGESNRYTIVPESGTAKRKDFVLTWEPVDESKMYTALFHEEVNGSLYSLVMIHPQAPDTITTSAYNREVVIVIDTSGSMQGTSIKQAKKALLAALDQLGENDLFNIIEFNTETRTLFKQNVAVNFRTISAAKSFVNSLAADRGTEMYPALVQALSGDRDPDRLFQVIFITDGCVGNEAELFAYIKKNIHNGRLFTVGIGSAPNHYFMRKAALSGRGTFLHIGDLAEVQEKMDRLFQKLACPVLTDISLTWSNSSAEILPDPVPDLYAGEPLTVCTRSYLGAGSLEVSGSFGEQFWHETFEFSVAGENNGIGKLWARRKIEGFMDHLLDGPGEEKIKKKVIDVALEHHLVSQYTSLVAVEQVKSRPDDEQMNKEKLPLMLPEGWEMGQSKGNYPAAGTEMWLFLSLGIALILISAFYLVLRKRQKT